MKRIGRKARIALFVLFILACAVVLLYRPAAAHVRAAALLERFTEAQADDGVVEETATLDGPHGPIKARFFTPHTSGHLNGIVLAHGVHRLGIEEPRLRRFAHAIAASGILVMTPEIAELADYRVDPKSIDTIAAAAHSLRDRTQAPVGLMGMSFAGGLSLLAAADPRYSPDIAFVVAIGAHDDLARVSRFFATGHIPRPDGSTLDMHAHDYGPLVLVYGHIEDFFPASDVPVARDALRAWLWENRDEARKMAEKLSPEAKSKMNLLWDAHVDAVAPELLTEIAKIEPSADAVSPHNHLANLHVPVFLLHGDGDTVIPATETLWLAKDVPHDMLRQVLVSPAIVHVELHGKPTLNDQWSLVHFMAGVLEASL